MMHMLRGVTTFLVIAAVFVVAECKKEENPGTPPSSSTTRARAASQAMAPASQLPCMGTADQLCGPPCTVTVDLDSGSVDPAHVWLYRGQDVTWMPQGAKGAKLVKLHFAKSESNPTSKKSGDKLLQEANCSTGNCVKAFTDASDCQSYRYTVRGSNGKVIDPDVEVGTTTYPFGVESETARTTGTH